MPFRREDTEDATSFWIMGSLDARTVPELRAAFVAFLDAGGKKATLELTGLRLIDSEGVSSIVWLYKRLIERGGELRVLGLSDQPLAVFRLLRLDRILPLG